MDKNHPPKPAWTILLFMSWTKYPRPGNRNHRKSARCVTSPYSDQEDALSACTAGGQRADNGIFYNQSFFLSPNTHKGGDHVNNKFFEKETLKARQRFNQTFGCMTVCDLKLRQSAIVGVSLLDLAQKRIQTETGEARQTNVRKFQRIRNALNNIFNQIESELNQRRQDHEQSQTASHAKTG
jgi:hypothetical protein